MVPMPKEMAQFVLPKQLQHIAIIMDGNGRWAQLREYTRTEGHKKGAETIRHIIEECARLHLPFLTIYAFSKENWKRPEAEVQSLFALITQFLSEGIDAIRANNIRLSFLGDIEKLPYTTRKSIEFAISTTEHNKGLHVHIALNYSGREEIVMACKTLLQKNTPIDTITEELFAKALYTSAIPDPDLIIRTGNEHRISNFLLFQCAYSELYFSPILWPDFSIANLHTAIQDFSTRTRRFGS